MWRGVFLTLVYKYFSYEPSRDLDHLHLQAIKILEITQVTFGAALLLQIEILNYKQPYCFSPDYDTITWTCGLWSPNGAGRYNKWPYRAIPPLKWYPMTWHVLRGSNGRCWWTEESTLSEVRSNYILNNVRLLREKCHFSGQRCCLGPAIVVTKYIGL